MFKRMTIMLILTGLVLAGIFGFHAFGTLMMKTCIGAMGVPPATISTMIAQQDSWRADTQSVGSLRAIQGADLSSEVAGIVQSINFESGKFVTMGTPLVQLRAEDDNAKLHALEASANLALITYNRNKKQLEIGAVSQAVIDNDSANLANLNAQVLAQRAVVEKKTIRAPFDGTIGIRQVDVGQYLNPGTAIATLQKLDALYLDFYLPEKYLSQTHIGQHVIAVTDAYPDAESRGTIIAINPKVDVSTRNIAVRAKIDNTGHLLRPGMYTKIRVMDDTAEDFITLPQTSIAYNPYGNTVFVIKEVAKTEKTYDDKGIGGWFSKKARPLCSKGKPVDTSKTQTIATQVFVKTGDRRGDQIQILDGIQVGDEVVTAGQLKLFNGIPVIVNNEIQPSNDPNPTPQEQ